MTDGAPQDATPRTAVLGFVRGFWTSRALWIAVKLGIPDLLAAGPRDSAELARATGTHAPSLHRVLRVLCTAGVFAQGSAERFELTSVGALLRSGTPDSLRAWVTVALGGEYYDAWGDLLHTVRTGEVAFEHALGDNVWAYRDAHPEQAALFDEAMASHSGPAADNLLASYSFAGFDRIVDVGGGDGAVVEVILRATPAVRAVVFELPQAAAKARERMRVTHLEARCEVIVGDMFDAVPRDGNAYLLSSVIHDWADEPAVAILKNCRHAMAPGATLLLFERLVPERGERLPTRAVMADLLMMVMYGGRERTEAEYRALLSAAGLRHTKTIATGGGLGLIEAVREG